jgi:AcrR family transcriptional regulator
VFIKKEVFMGTSERRLSEIKSMKKLILDTAMELIIHHGFESVSIRKIAERIQYSPATIYLYFKDKQDILHQLHEEGFRRFANAQKGLADIADPLERLYEHGRVYIRFALENREYYQLMFMLRGTEKRCVPSAEPDGSQETYKVLRSNVIDYLSAGYLPGADVDATTFLFWSTVHGMVSLIISERIAISEAKLQVLAINALGVLRSMYSNNTHI